MLTIGRPVLRGAWDDLIGVAGSGEFGPPPANEWDHRRLLAHIAAADAGIAAVALAVTSGQRPGYDNRYSLDEAVLDATIESAGDLDGLIALVRDRAALMCAVCEHLTSADLATPVPCLIISGDQVMADAQQPLGRLLGGVARVHLPAHTRQLASLQTR